MSVIEMAHVLKRRLTKSDWDSLNEDQIAEFRSADSFWRDNGLNDITRRCYRGRVMLFLRYCRFRRLDPNAQLTDAGVTKFAREFSRARGVGISCVLHDTRPALMNWAQVRQSLGVSTPPWRSKDHSARAQPQILNEFKRDLERCGLAPGTIYRHLKAGDHLLTHLRSSGRDLRQLQIRDVDDLIAKRRRHISLSSVKQLCGGLRRFLRFLYATKQHKRDLSMHFERLFAPGSEGPPRALPWDSVQAILRAVDRSTPIGRRDYAMLLMMSIYGCGAGEMIDLQLEDIDWYGNRLRLRRRKTRVPIELPLLPEVARAVADYLQHGRPKRVSTRAVFVCTRCPHQTLSSATVIAHRIKRYAAGAGVEAEFFGTHALRHSHASRQFELGTPPKVISDILGHGDPRSTGVYLRGALERLRKLALRVPT